MKNIETAIFTDGSVIVIVWKNKEKWPITFITESVRGILGYSKDEFLKTTLCLKDILIEESLKKLEREIAKFVDFDAHAFNLSPFQAKSKDNSTIWLEGHIKPIKDKDGNIVSFYGYFVDITAQLETKNRLDVVFDGIADGVVLVDIETKKILKANNAFINIFGFDIFELINMSILELGPEDKKEEMLGLMQSILKKETTYAKEIELIKKDKSQIYANITANTIYFNQRHSIIALIKDITELKRMGEERKKHEKIFLQQSRLAAMGEMISMIAHQWRQPLSTISTISANLQIAIEMNTIEQNALSKSLNEINTQTQYLSKTINDFRDFFNPNKLETATLLCDIVEKATSIISKTLHMNGIKLNTSCELNAPILTHPNELVQVLLNIIKNANDAHIKAKKENQYINIKGYETKEEQIIEISDNAGGIDEKIICNIFDPYFTTKDEKNGTGLGLYISKIIIETHCNGKLQVKNIYESGKLTGVKFIIGFFKNKPTI